MDWFAFESSNATGKIEVKPRDGAGEPDVSLSTLLQIVRQRHVIVSQRFDSPDQFLQIGQVQERMEKSAGPTVAHREILLRRAYQIRRQAHGRTAKGNQLDVSNVLADGFDTRGE